jgi:hypothetical protein
VVQGVRTVEVGLRKNSLDIGGLLDTLMDMMKFGDLVWYYVHDGRKITVLDVSDEYT